MSAIDAGPPTPTEGIADRVDVVRIARSLAAELFGAGGYCPADVVQLAYFLAAGESDE